MLTVCIDGEWFLATLDRDAVRVYHGPFPSAQDATNEAASLEAVEFEDYWRPCGGHPEDPCDCSLCEGTEEDAD